MADDLYARVLARLEVMDHYRGTEWERIVAAYCRDSLKLLRALLVERQHLALPDYCDTDDIAAALRREDADAVSAALREFAGGPDE